MKTAAALCQSWGQTCSWPGLCSCRCGSSLRLNEGPAERRPWEPCPHQALNSMKAHPISLISVPSACEVNAVRVRQGVSKQDSLRAKL